MKTIVIGGDSINKGFDDYSQKDDSGWPQFLSPMWFTSTNYAVSGSTAKQWADNFGNRLNKLLSTDCDAIVMSLGANDVMQAMADGTLTIEEVSTTLTSLNKVYSTIIASGKRLIVLLYANPRTERKDMELGVKLLNAAIMSVAPANVTFIDPGLFLTQFDFYDRGIHPNPNGYRKIATELEEVLGKLLS